MVSRPLFLAAVLIAPVQSVQPAWAPGVAYRTGDLAGYLGVTYLCLQAHTSRAGLEPPAAPGLWRVFCGPETEAPATPQGLAAVPDGPSRIAVSWGPARGATSYDLERDGAVAAGVTSPFLHKDLAPGSAHVYRVRAVNDGGHSAWSEPVACATERATSGR